MLHTHSLPVFLLAGTLTVLLLNLEAVLTAVPAWMVFHENAESVIMPVVDIRVVRMGVRQWLVFVLMRRMPRPCG